MSNLFTFKQFPEKHPAWTELALRNMRFHQESNGFKGAFVQIGRRVLIDEAKFFECIENLNKRAA